MSSLPAPVFAALGSPTRQQAGLLRSLRVQKLAARWLTALYLHAHHGCQLGS